ncbi:hypothetical protein AGMMS50212_05590 [Spirochaetia bacterium]|nr:hypothetical protein AGMMS50212_05590 [Spirochaetia bacterium]
MGNVAVFNLLGIQMKKLRELDMFGDNNYGRAAFAYISSKAASYLTMSSDIYKEGDYFNYPLDEWDGKNLRMGCEQIIYNCSGIDKNNPWMDLSIHDIKNLFELFHYSFFSIEKVSNEKNIYALKFIHKMSEQTYTTYCINREEDHSNNEIQYLNVPTKEGYTKVSVDNESKVVKIFSNDDGIGVESEYSYIRMLYKNFKRWKQTLSQKVINNKNTWIDTLYFESDNKQYEQIFDISEFYELDHWELDAI